MRTSCWIRRRAHGSRGRAGLDATDTRKFTGAAARGVSRSDIEQRAFGEVRIAELRKCKLTVSAAGVCGIIEARADDANHIRLGLSLLLAQPDRNAAKDGAHGRRSAGNRAWQRNSAHSAAEHVRHSRSLSLLKF